MEFPSSFTTKCWEFNKETIESNNLGKRAKSKIEEIYFPWNTLVTPQQAHDVNRTSPQRRCNVMTLHRRWANVVWTSCACWAIFKPKKGNTASSLLPSKVVTMLDRINITRTCLYNSDPLKPHFYIVKLGFTGVYFIFLISAQKHRLWVLVRTTSLRRGLAWIDPSCFLWGFIKIFQGVACWGFWSRH